MEYESKTGERLSFTPDEYKRLIELGVLPNPGRSVASNNKHEVDGHKKLKTNQEDDQLIDPDLFFLDLSPLMAKILHSLIQHGGEITQLQLTQEMGKSGQSLRRPNGALNNRIREASAGRIKEFYKVREPNRNNGQTDRTYSITPEILEFLRVNFDEIPSGGQPEEV
jgi:hypothetical protein